MRPAAPTALALLLVPLLGSALGWEFEDPIPVTGVQGEGIFHHLESSGRRNLALSGEHLAVAWEDNRDGTPRIYLARKSLKAGAFGDGLRISGPGEAYEPSVVGLGEGRFAVAWEEDRRVRVRLVGPRGLGPIHVADSDQGSQASLARDGGELLVLWSVREGRFARIRMERLSIGPGDELSAMAGCAVDPEPLEGDQLYPAVAVVGGRIVAAWEDRRLGHTVIMAAVSPSGARCSFDRPRRISREPPGPQMPYGSGSGVSRVALAAYGDSGVLAAWADKRNFREGYDIYAARYTGEEEGFGVNVPVQDAFGGVAQQWHAAAAGGGDGAQVVAWDDDRNGHADVMLSWSEDGGWSDDLAVPGASGPGSQTHPALALGPGGDLHIAWIERQARGSPTRLRYLRGRLAQD